MPSRRHGGRVTTPAASETRLERRRSRGSDHLIAMLVGALAAALTLLLISAPPAE